MNPSEMTVLVTGGAGFIGSHLIDRLVSDGYNIRIVDNLSTGNLDNIKSHLNNGQVELIKGDIRDLSLVKESLQDINIVIHLAALTSVPYSIKNPKITFEINTEATSNLIRLCKSAKVERFIFASSCAVYGDSRPLPVTENIIPNPLSPYAESKLKAEQCCLKYGLHSNVLRFFNVYGSRQGISDYSGVITRFSECIKRNESLTIYGDGSQSRDFINVTDIVNAILLTIESNIKPQIFNIGSGCPTSIIQLAKLALNLTNSNLPITFVPPRAGDIKASYADISKAKKILGFEPHISFEDGLAELLLGVHYPS